MNFLSLKILNSFLAILYGFIQIKFFISNWSTEVKAFALTIFSIYVYFSFFDFGVTKPIYANLRKKYITKKKVGSVINEIQLILIFSLLVFVGSYLVSLVYREKMVPEIDSKVSIYIALIFCSTFLINGFKSFYEAIDRFILFECIDIARRLALIFLCISINLGINLVQYLKFLTFINITITLVVTFVLFKKLSVRLSNIFLQGIKFSNIKIYLSDSINNLKFSITDITFNNFIIVVAPWFASGASIIVIQVWFKLMRGFSLFFKSAVESKIPGLTKLFHIHDRVTFFEILNRYIKFSIIYSILVYVCLRFLGAHFFSLIEFDYQSINLEWFYITISLATGFVSAIHLIGIVLLSIGRCFKYLYITTLIFLFAQQLFSWPVFLLNPSLYVIIVLNTLIYGCKAIYLWYYGCRTIRERFEESREGTNFCSAGSD